MGGARPLRAAPRLGDWAAGLGRFDAFEPLRASFAASIESRGADATLRSVLPALWPGIAAAAFHGPIRTAHAVQSQHDGELAAALAYWAARWQSLPAPHGGAPWTLSDWAASLEAAASDFHSDEPLISGRMRQAGEGHGYREIAGRLQTGPATWSELARWAAGLYASSGNFTVLHIVTGIRAVRVLMPWVDDTASLAASAVPAIAAATIASSVKRRPHVPNRLPDWPAIIRAAIASNDDHVVKLVHACVEMGATDGDPPFLAAAARATT